MTTRGALLPGYTEGAEREKKVNERGMVKSRKNEKNKIIESVRMDRTRCPREQGSSEGDG